MRLFFAVELPREIRAILSQLRPRDPETDYRWVDPATLHVTLAFLGNQPEERLPMLEAIGRDAATASHAGHLSLGTAGSFGAKRAPRVLWVDLAGDVETLGRLQRELDERLRAAGFPVEDRPFRPHVTLARRRESARGGPPHDWPPNVDHAKFALRQLTLFESHLSPRGPTYTPVFEFPLSG